MNIFLRHLSLHLLHRRYDMETAIYLVICALVSTLPAASTVPSFAPSSSPETLRNFVLFEPDLIVGSSKYLYRLSTSLSVRQNLTLGTPNRLLVTDPNGSYRGKVLDCGTRRCSLLNMANIHSPPAWQVSSSVLRDGPDNVVGVFAPGPNGTSSLTLGEKRIEEDRGFPIPSLISKGDLVNVNTPASPSFGAFAFHEESSNLRTREFLAAFNYRGYVYLVTRIQLIDANIKIILARFCELDKGMRDGSNPSLFTSHFELELQCSPSGGSGMNMLLGISAAFLNTTSTESIVLVSANGDNTTVTNYLCTYSLDTINQLMSEKLQSCIDGTGGTGFTREGDQGNCPNDLPDEQKRVSILCLQHWQLHVFNIYVSPHTDYR